MPIYRCATCQKPFRATDERQRKCPECDPPAAAPVMYQPIEQTDDDLPQLAIAPSRQRRTVTTESGPSAQTVSSARRKSRFEPPELYVSVVAHHAWATYRDNLGMSVFLTLFCIVVSLCCHAAVGVGVYYVYSGPDNIVPYLASVFGGAAVLTIINLWLGAGYSWYFIKAARDEPRSIFDLFRAVRFVPQMFVAWLIIELMKFAAAVVCFLPAGINAFLFAEAPNLHREMGLVFVGTLVNGLASLLITLVFGQSYFAIVDRKLGPIRALGHSRMITGGNRMAILTLLILAALLISSGFLILGATFYYVTSAQLAMVMVVVGMAAVALIPIFTLPLALLLFIAAYVNLSYALSDDE